MRNNTEIKRQKSHVRYRMGSCCTVAVHLNSPPGYVAFGG